ncbi:MerR family transcriptional regulator [Planctomycetota bacterium]|jgi:DNA-binding transcriptional MerR regulator|nr:MerR family transcriptional regulator [Planctomycetota bacterium]|tara:strand:+ start:497 stop:1399 length:903 start_codon:yes stop_codon:yes gene_type:complete
MGESQPTKGLYSIGDVSSITGLSPHTIRVWEKRYGNPLPERLPSGHRRYSRASVNLLQAAAELVSYGLRPSKILTKNAEEVEALLIEERHNRTPYNSEIVEKAIGLNGDALRLLLEESMRNIGVRSTLYELVIPLVQRIGQAWADQEIDIYQEHLLSEALEDVLRSTRLQISAPKIPADCVDLILVTMPGELHGLGLQILALLAALEGCTAHRLGVDLPIAQIVEFSKKYPKAAVAISVSSAADISIATRQLAELRNSLHTDTPLIAGGAGMLRRKPIKGVIPITNLSAFEEWLQQKKKR